MVPPCDSTASHAQAISPYVFAVPTCNHTPDAFPHTLQQIPISRSSLYTFSADPHIRYASSKESDFKCVETSDRFRKCRANLSHTFPEPASQPHKSSTNQVTQILQTCDWHLLHVRVRPWSYLHGHTRIFTRMHAYHCHTCTAMGTPARPWAHQHGYAHTCTYTRTFTAMLISLRARL